MSKLSSSSNFKRPESILIVMYTNKSDVLVLRRTNPNDFWQSVTGSLEWGEDAVDAAYRELKEETGLVASPEVELILVDHKISNYFPILPAWREKYDPEVEHNMEHVFSLQLDQVINVRLNSEEHTEYQWLTRSDAIEKVTSYTNKKAIADIVPI